MKSRISGKKVAINDGKTRDFFDMRTSKILPHRYNYVNYQDSNPELAIERDQYEKRLVQKYLQLDNLSRVLDIGCGVGRWGDEIITHFTDKSGNGIYVGVDYSKSLLAVAQEHFRDNTACHFICASFQGLKEALKASKNMGEYSHVLINGVLAYINDADIDKCLDSVNMFVKQGGVVYIKEPIGVMERLTLNSFFSSELSSEYSAIYRSLKEYTCLFAKHFFKKTYSLIACSPTWPEDLSNRKETMSYYWILRK